MLAKMLAHKAGGRTQFQHFGFGFDQAGGQIINVGF